MELYQLIALIACQGGPYSAILNFSRVEHFPVSAETIKILAKKNPAVPEDVIVCEQNVCYELSRMFELSRGSMEGQLHIVHSLNEAYGLLGVNSEDFLQRLFPEASAA